MQASLPTPRLLFVHGALRFIPRFPNKGVLIILVEISSAAVTTDHTTTMTKPTDIDPSPTSGKIVNKTVTVNAPTSKVWDALTNPELMKKWMSETEIDIRTDWKVGAPLVIRGNLHGINFENKGSVLQVEREKILQYSHLSSLSRLPDEPASYSVIEFRLAPLKNQTSLTLTVSNFPTETIYKHLAYYWMVTLEILKKMIEQE
jgi:uncharacterized protein YndB with AHSA1/START domain